MAITEEIKKRFDRTVIIAVAVTFVIGLVAGFGIWGAKKEKKPDVKQILNTLVREIEGIEKENAALKAQIKKTATDSETAARLTRENQGLKEQLQKAVRYNQQLKDETALVRAGLAEAEKRAQKTENLQAMKDKLQQRVLELEKENHDLRSALEKIVSITKEQGNEQKTTGPGAGEEPAVPGY